MSKRFGRWTGVSCCFFGCMSNRLPVLASAPTGAIAGADTSTDSRQDCESSDFSLVSALPALAPNQDLRSCRIHRGISSSLISWPPPLFFWRQRPLVLRTPQSWGKTGVSLHKLHELARRLFVEILGSARNTQRSGQRGIIIPLIGFLRRSHATG